jgi:hypothetical protein
MRADARRNHGLQLLLLTAGACLALLALIAPGASAAEEEIPRGGARIIEYSASPSDNQAGGHPDIKIHFKVGTKVDPVLENYPGNGNSIKEALVELPAGFIGNPHAAPRCTTADFSLDKCPIDSQIGYVQPGIELTEGCLGNPSTCEGLQFFTPLYNLVPPPDQAGLLGFKAIIFSYPTYTVFSARTNGDYGLDARVTGISQLFTLRSFNQWMWGIPASHANDSWRFLKGGWLPENPFPIASNSPEKAFLSSPTTCSGPLSSTFHSYAFDFIHFEKTAPWPETLGCDLLGFDPSLSASPSTTEADTASGVDIALQVPQPESPNAPSNSQIKAVRVTFPEGFTINPNAADGKVACDAASISFETRTEGNCPQFSKVGSLSLLSSALPEALPGSIYLGEPLPGDRYRIFTSADGYGTHVKLKGTAHLDPQTGRMTVAFENLPQSPFTRFDMHFFGSERGLFATPTRCGRYPVETNFTPWDASLPDQQSTQFFEVNSGPGGSACPGDVRPFAPTMRAVGQGNAAGAHSTFSFLFSRSDGDQNLDGIDVQLPPGLLARIKGIPYCPEAALAQASSPSYTGLAETAAPSCPAASAVGKVTAGAGAGNHPLYSPGTAYLAGPYKGAPLSLAMITPAVSGPYDLGNVVIRVALSVDPETAQVTAVSDPLPRILEGIPLRLRSVQVDLDRSNMVLNPTSCDPLQVRGTITGSEGGLVTPSSYFQVGNCGSLDYEPRLSVKVTGGLARRGHPAIHAVLDAGPGEANTRKVSVTLPQGELLDNSHINTICTRVQYAARNCPAGSVLGNARAKTPLLDDPLKGTAYLRSGPNKLPDIAIDLRGQIDLTLVGKIDTGKGGALRTTFSTIPDAPVEEFRLDLAGGKKGLLQNSKPICGRDMRLSIKMVGHNGARYGTNPQLQSNCGNARKKKPKRGAAR